jgi:hypothetical protein
VVAKNVLVIVTFKWSVLSEISIIQYVDGMRLELGRERSFNGKSVRKLGNNKYDVVMVWLKGPW